MIMVGALNVGSIELVLPYAEPVRNRPQNNIVPHLTVPQEGPALPRGAEFGRFNMGSTVIVLGSRGWLTWQGSIRSGVRVRLGEPLAQVDSADLDRR
jgi:phosphatidylserine decarboxylase